MSRDVIELTISDLSQFTKTLRASLPQAPGHAETLGLIAKAAGYKNFQHLRASGDPAPKVNEKRVTKALRCFNPQGKLARWPGKTNLQSLSLWSIWAQLPTRIAMTEREISDRINALTSFQDAAQIRRGFIENRMFSRSLDGSDYLRVEQAIPPDALALIRQLKMLAEPEI